MKHLPRVLIVEDEPAIAELIAVNLRHGGFNPAVAYDSVAAQRELDAVLRRRAPESVSDSVTLGALVLDAATHRISYQGQELKLGPTEFKLMHHLMRNPERVHSRSSLLDKVWGDHVFIEERTVDVHVKRLREALGAAGPMVETVRGAGYRLTAVMAKGPAGAALPES